VGRYIKQRRGEERRGKEKEEEGRGFTGMPSIHIICTYRQACETGNSGMFLIVYG
jgi:hypothetical protein